MVEYVFDGGPERAAAATALHAEVFKTDPVTCFLVHNMTPQRQNQYIPVLMRTLIWAATLSGATFDEAWTHARPDTSDSANVEPPQSSAVWMPPGAEVGSSRAFLSMDFFRLAWNIGFGGLRRMLGEVQANSDRAKRKHLVTSDGSRIKKYHYLFFISTDPAERGKGLSSELITRFQEKVRPQSAPIWLESTTERSHRLYSKLGFKDVDSWVVGKGVVDKEGKTCKGGAGVTIWAMIWWPNGEGEASK